jgi:GNAT superfamily N-acetyltransferase
VSERAGERAGATRHGTVRVRPARREDLARIWELMRGLAEYERLLDVFTGSAEQLGRHLFDGARPPVDAFVAEVDGALVGYAVAYFVFSTFWTRPILWLEDLYVEPDRRGTGAGRALMQTVAAHAVAHGAPRVAWDVLDWNTPSIAFYERLGATRGTGWFNYRVEGEALRTLARPAGAPG